MDTVKEERSLFSESSSAFDAIEKDCQRVLNELISDKSLEKFRQEYEKLHYALEKSHQNEKKLISKCRELNSELISNASKVGTAIRLSTEDQNSIALLKNEIDKAWKMVDLSQEKEKKAKRTIEQLRSEMQNLTKLMNEGTGLNMGQESTLNELLRTKEELGKELDEHQLKVNDQRNEIESLMLQLDTLSQEKSNLKSQLKELTKMLHKSKQELHRYSRRAERAEKQLLDMKNANDEKDTSLQSKLHEISCKDANIDSLQSGLNQKQNEINKLNCEFDSLKLQSQELIEQLELMKEDEVCINDEKLCLMNQVKQKQTQIEQHKNETHVWRKQVDKLSKEYSTLADKYGDSELQRKKLKQLIEQAKKDLENQIRDQKNDHKITKTLQLDLKKLTTSLQASKRRIEQLQVEWKNMRQKNKELSHDLTLSNEKIVEATKENLSLAKNRQRISAQANQLHGKTKKLNWQIDNLHVAADDMNTTIREERNKLKTQQQLYENIRSERNLFGQQLNEARDGIAELKRKSKITSHQMEQYKEENASKDKALIKQHFEIKELNETVKSLEKQKSKKDDILQQADKLLSSQDTEIKTLRRTLAEAEATQKSQKQIFDAVVDERDILGAQLIRRNDELALLYDKMRLMESTLEKGELQYRDLLVDCRNLKLQLQDHKGRLEMRNQQVASIQSLKQEVHHLQRELLQERTKAKALSEELENPINVHRWRKLMGSDPDQYEMIQKVRTLQKRLITKTEKIVEKDLIINEKERLYVELKNLLARQPGPEVLEQLTTYQQTLKGRTRQMKANTAELNMLQTQVSEFKFECQRLTKELAEMKRKYFEQRKKEQLWKEQSRQNANPNVNQNQTIQNKPSISNTKPLHANPSITNTVVRL